MKKCSIDNCTRMATGGISGKCRSHQRNYLNNKTSDGNNTRRNRKLSAEQVTEARQMRAALRTNREIAQHFGISLPTLRAYMRGDRS